MERVDTLPNENPESLVLAVPADKGESDEAERLDWSGDSGDSGEEDLKAVRSMRSEFRGWRVWNRVFGMVMCERWMSKGDGGIVVPRMTVGEMDVGLACLSTVGVEVVNGVRRISLSTLIPTEFAAQSV